jgi:hypothetical protein
MKGHMLSLAVTPVIFCCVSIFCCGAVNQLAVSPVTQAQKPEDDLDRAEALFHKGKFSEAALILERLANANPSDDQAVFGLGVALIYAAWGEKDIEKRKQLVIRARQVLTRAKDLGAEDYFFTGYLKDLPADGDDDKTKTVERLANFWIVHPPMIFDCAPPEGIKLPEGYRHKASTNLEERTAGVIWKRDGLKINYEFASWAGGGDVVKGIPESLQVWRRKIQSEGLEVEYVLTKGGCLIISTYSQGGKYADFFVSVSDERGVEEALAIIKGLKPRKR